MDPVEGLTYLHAQLCRTRALSGAEIDEHLILLEAAVGGAAHATAVKTATMTSVAAVRACCTSPLSRFCCGGHFFHTAAATAAAGAPARIANPPPEHQVPSAAQIRLLRAGTLLLNDPPPEYEVSVHRGLKVQASLLLQRLPLVYREPPYEQRFRLFKEEWERKTNNSTILNDEITYMQMPGHFLETQQQQEQREKQQQKTGDAELSELDMLLQQEGLMIDRHKMGKQRRKQQEDAVSPAIFRAAVLHQLV